MQIVKLCGEPLGIHLKTKPNKKKKTLGQFHCETTGEHRNDVYMLPQHMVKQVQNQDVSPNCNWRSLQNVEVCLLLLDLITDLQWLLSEQLQTEAQPKLGLCSRLHSASAEA